MHELVVDPPAGARDHVRAQLGPRVLGGVKSGLAVYFLFITPPARGTSWKQLFDSSPVQDSPRLGDDEILHPARPRRPPGKCNRARREVDVAVW